MDGHPLDTDGIRGKTKGFISRHFKSYDLRDDEDIFSLGFVNSLFAMQLVIFVEKEFQMKVDDEDLQIENFRTVNALVDLVRRKRKL